LYCHSYLLSLCEQSLLTNIGLHADTSSFGV
jgi:hypothetical protein